MAWFPNPLSAFGTVQNQGGHKIIIASVFYAEWNTQRLTVDKLLLTGRNDTAEVGAVLSAVFLRILPGVPVSEVPAGWRVRT